MWQEPKSIKNKQKQLSIVFALLIGTAAQLLRHKGLYFDVLNADVAGTKEHKKQAKTIEYCFCPAYWNRSAAASPQRIVL